MNSFGNKSLERTKFNGNRTFYSEGGNMSNFKKIILNFRQDSDSWRRIYGSEGYTKTY